MREITKQMIKDYRIKELGYDFMGYYKQPKEIYNFHHLIVPYRNCNSRGLGEGYVRWNGAILCAESSHPYLHLIEQFDLESYLRITSEMIEMNLRGKLMIQNLKAIRGNGYRFIPKGGTFSTETIRLVVRSSGL